MKKLFYLLIALLVVSCGLWEYRGLSELKDMTWMKSDVQTFTANIEEPGNYDVLILLRHVHGFPYAQVAVNMTMTGPGAEVDDTFTIPVIGEDREYLGEGSGDIWDLEHVALPAYSFEKGEYTFTLSHGMAKDDLELVMEVGVMVRKPKE